MKFNEMAELFLQDKRRWVKPSTICNYNTVLKRPGGRLGTYFGEKEATQKNFNRQELERFAVFLTNEGLALHTVNDYLMITKMVLRFGTDHKLCGCFEDMRMIRKPAELKRRRKKEVKTFTDVQQRKIMRYIEKHVFDDIPLIGIYIALSCGLRIGEVCGLKWEDIVIGKFKTPEGGEELDGELFVNRTVERLKFPDGKTRVVIGSPKTESSQRHVPMQPKLVEIMQELKSYTKVFKPGNYILTNKEKPTEPRTYRNRFYRLLDKLELPHLVFHDCRHTFATRCIESDVDVKVTALYLGHSDVSTTYNYYVHPTEKQRKEGIKRMYNNLKLQAV